MNDFFTGVLPWLLWVGRIALSAVAVLLLIRCGRTLLSGGKQESWGFLSLSNGARYPLYHWENMIGRARQADIRINFPSVSRSHAALCRDSEGIWRIYPIRTGGTLLNGTVVERPTALNPGDALSMGGVDIYFFPDQKQARRPVRTAASPGTLWLLTLFQVLMFLQFLPGLTAGASLPVCIGFGGLVLLSWVFCSLRRTGSRGLEILALLLTTVGFAVTAAYDSHSLYKQLAAVVLGMGLYLLMDRVLQSLPLALKLRWPLVAAASALLAFNVLFGQRIFGAKNWIAVGPITFQPSELVKIVFILAGAATLDRLFAKRNLIFTILFSAYCVGCLALMSDFGTALIFFVAFLCIAFLRTGDLPSIVMITAAARLCRGHRPALQALCAGPVCRLAARLGIRPGGGLSADPHHVRRGLRRSLRRRAGGGVAEIRGRRQHGSGVRRGIRGVWPAAGPVCCSRRDPAGHLRPAGRRTIPLQLLRHRRLRHRRHAGVPDHPQRAGFRGPAAPDRRHLPLRLHGRLQYAVLLGAAGLFAGGSAAARIRQGGPQGSGSRRQAAAGHRFSG